MILEPHIELVGKCGNDLLFGRVPSSSECLGDKVNGDWLGNMNEGDRKELGDLGQQAKSKWY